MLRTRHGETMLEVEGAGLAEYASVIDAQKARQAHAVFHI